MYRHFRSRSALVSAIADRFLAPLRLTIAVTDNWRFDFETRIRQLEALYRSHPATAILIVTEAELSGTALEEVALGAQILRRSGASERNVFMTLHAVEVAVVGSITYDCVGGSQADLIRRKYHQRVGQFDVDALFPTVEEFAAESSATMWVLVGAALDRLEQAASNRQESP